MSAWTLETILVHSTYSWFTYSATTVPYYRAVLACTLIFSAGETNAQTTTPIKIDFQTGGFTGELDDDDHFANSIASLGDIDGDGVADLAAGAPGDDDGVGQHGAVWILFMNAGGTVKSHQNISDREGRFERSSGDDGLGLGSFLANGTDLDGDGRDELLYGGKTSVYTLFLNEEGTVRMQAMTLTSGDSPA